ncbi:putative photosynthetic complex assembly protein PuhE [Falsiroseomonas ponticola]|jgi:putative photosynthetic complex assembly protein 2|uniref:putative photosynthetic complex assembly protein PuhE n=1 Tax=Falsiroseomonas ponticola TaxID=2786951 RepID=UPI0019313D13|nr:putative photosynthetic complex assembly protein PuhE [Roseomonas ponticola]
MAEHGLPALFTLFLWWFSTGVILYLDGLRQETFRWTMLGASTLALAGLAGLHATAWDTTTQGAYIAFVCGVLVWGWIETAFLTGMVTGPSRRACPPGATGWVRLRAALAAILWHELAIVAGALLILAVTWGGSNQVGFWTFIAFWVMRQSAKLNVYLGVRNLAEAFLPDHLRYLESFFRRRRMNALFPVSVIAGTAACVLLSMKAAAPGATPHEVAGYSLLASLVALGLLEHWFMVLPVPADALWRWGLASRSAAQREGRPAPAPVA